MDVMVIQKLTIKPKEALYGTKKLIYRKGKRLEVTIPPGVKNGTLIKLSGALQITDGYYGDLFIQTKVNKHYRLGIIAAVAMACFFIIMYLLPTEGTSPYIYENGAILVGGDGEPIELINNTDATNPTYANLIAFIVEDTTDTNAFIEEGAGAYVCADFAEDVHNNAEKAGIKAAWVSINFEGDDEGHAINAFETTDRGVVYIDCTGGYLSSRLTDQSMPTSWDTIAYIEIEKEYGVIDIAEAKLLSYSFYEEYTQKLQEYDRLLSDYNEDVIRYNQEIKGKVYYEDSQELTRIENWEASLEKKEELLTKLIEELGNNWFEPLGIVQDIYIHW